MENFTSFIPVIGPVVAAALTAAIAFVVSVLAKENKTSEFRQAWIEGLRNDVAELLGDFNMLETSLAIYIGSSETNNERQIRYDKFHSDNRSEYAKIDALCNRVVLRLNPSEHSLLIKKMRVLEGSIGKGSTKSHALCSELVDDFAMVLKSEWARVKSGEPTFRAMKKVALISVLAVFVPGLISVGFLIFAK
ncbi:hypothetical protein [Pseudomonas sp. B21-053]|uniref:hypothetical protein n=1 Tax=Pseudomonas sp. B21-053 TaxID=2895493 RepID=UPI002232628C|nr:hypothetical protein [Pseudomonas sp. B21-053]UZE14750.1 hypothetical protein LOY68_14450 [Pseudomonas sp. B21-053]